MIRANVGSYNEAADWGSPSSLLYRSGPWQRIPITTPIEAQVKHLKAFRPDSLLVYPSNLAALAAAFQKEGARLEGLSHIRTIGETLSPSVRALGEAVFGAPV